MDVIPPPGTVSELGTQQSDSEVAGLCYLSANSVFIERSLNWLCYSAQHAVRNTDFEAKKYSLPIPRLIMAKKFKEADIKLAKL